MFFGAWRFQPFSREESENHGREGWNEAQRGPSAFVEDKRMLSRKQVEKPLIECPGEIGIFVPMREKASVVVIPILRNADGRVIEVGAWRRIESESRPKANQDQHERDHLCAHPREAEQEEEDVA